MKVLATGSLLALAFLPALACAQLLGDFEVATDKAADLIKRLTMYRLRAKVQFTDHSADMRVLGRVLLLSATLF